MQFNALFMHEFQKSQSYIEKNAQKENICSHLLSLLEKMMDASSLGEKFSITKL